MKMAFSIDERWNEKRDRTSLKSRGLLNSIVCAGGEMRYREGC
jgi:hypothetical protein